jgi:thioredoxin reductase
MAEVLIVGGEAAGYTAGIFAALDRCHALRLEKPSAGGPVLNCAGQERAAPSSSNFPPTAVPA